MCPGGRDLRIGGGHPAIRLMITPMVDLTFLLLVFFMLLPFRSLDRKFDAYLPLRHS